MERLLIGEIGINHNGDLNIAKKLIVMAKQSGCDYVKFQKRNPEVSVPNHMKNKYRDTPWGYISYLDYKYKIEFNKKEYDEINAFCKKQEIEWFASVWDQDSLKFMQNYNLPLNKIASALITNIDLVEAIASDQKKTLISTGMCTFEDIDKAVNIFEKKRCEYVLMHSVSSYPAPEKDLNLSLITKLKDKYKCQVGYSGHESSVSPSIIAGVLGAEYIERHITLDRAMWGTDQAASLSSEGLKILSNVYKKIDLFYGDSVKTISEDELKKLATMKYW